MTLWRIAVLARAPVPGRAKTRMTPPLTDEQAARLQAACIADVLERYADVPQRYLHFDGEHPGWSAMVPAGWTLVPQPVATLGGRMEAALSDASVTVVVGTDSPDLPRHMLEAAVEAVLEGRCDVGLIPAEDGGFCALVARRLPPGVLDGVAWSRTNTLACTIERLESLGLRAACFGGWYDLDTVADLHRLQVESRRHGAEVPTRVLALLQELGTVADATLKGVPSGAGVAGPSTTEQEHE